jgi:hypothetical protein
MYCAGFTGDRRGLRRTAAEGQTPHEWGRKTTYSPGTRWCLVTMSRWFKSRARNHLQADRSLGFCFEIRI